MFLLNESVKHISFGDGIITEADDNRVLVEFEGDIGEKLFQYPEAFEKFLKVANPVLEDKIIEDLHIKQEQLEQERIEKERKAAELEEKLKALEPKKKKTTRKKKL